MKTEYKWIAQDKDGRICMFELEPVTTLSPYTWSTGYGCRDIGEVIQNNNLESSLINLETHDYKWLGDWQEVEVPIE